MSKSSKKQRSTTFVFLPPLILVLAAAFLFLDPVSHSDAELDNLQPAMPQVADRLDPPLVLNPEMPPIESANSGIDFSQYSLGDAASPWVVVNKQRALNPINYVPQKLLVPESTQYLDNSRKISMAEITADALHQMSQAMNAEGAGKIFVNSGYRSFEYQGQLFESKIVQYGMAEALIRSAKAGHSEHQTGLAIDVSAVGQGCAIMQCFGDTDAGRWIAQNSWRFGFVVRYELDQTQVTGYTYEPWHLRYLGTELASEYFLKDFKTLEEFWNLAPATNYLED